MKNGEGGIENKNGLSSGEHVFYCLRDVHLSLAFSVLEER